MDKKDPMLLRDLLDYALMRDDSTRFAQQKACYRWIDVVGPGIMKYTSRRHVEEDGTMVVEITSAPLKQELILRADKIVELLNAAVGKNVITKLRII